MISENYVIETKDLTKSFGDFVAVDNLNLKIKEEEIFGFLGPNGAGKTTAIRMMVGLLSPTRGTVLMRDDDEKSELKIGICPQDLVFWDGLTSYENIYFMGKMYNMPKKSLRSKAEKILSDLNLSDKRDNLASELSGGMKRRLNLGISLIHDPDILVLDEPSAGLDPQSRYDLWEYISRLSGKKNKTVILTTHLMEEADRLSDRVAIMDRGELLTVDSPERLKRSVGEGDSITIDLKDPDRNMEALDIIKSIEGVLEASQADGSLFLRALDAVGQVTRFTEALEDKGFQISDVSISRTNTLEDVFIHLTGKEFEG